MSSLTLADCIIVGIIAISVLISFLRGFVREAISLCVWGLAIILGLKYAGPLGNAWFTGIHSPELRYITVFIILFLVIMIVGMIISAIIRALMDKTGLGIVDRFLGVVFGFARGVLLVAMALMFIEMSSWAHSDWMKSSYAVEKMEPLVKWLNSFVPEQVGVVSEWVGQEQSSEQGE